MPHFTQILIDAILASCGAAIFTGICVWVKGLYKKSKTFDNTLKALATDAYFRFCRELLPHKDLTEDEIERFNLLYSSYHSLGLNSTGDKLYQQIIAKPVKIDRKEVKNNA